MQKAAKVVANHPHRRLFFRRVTTQQRDYLRHLNGPVHRDAAGKEIAARNVILQYVSHPYDSRGRPTPNLIGSGPIDFYSMGQRFRGTWSKSSPASPTVHGSAVAADATTGLP